MTITPDIAIEGLRVLVIATLWVLLWRRGRKESLTGLDGWREIMVGVSLILFATLLDLSDNFPALNRFVIIGDTPIEAFLEKVVGYLVGDLLLFLGFWRWILMVPKLDKARRDLQVQEARFRAMVETTTDWVWAVDEIGRYTYASPLISDLLGYSPDEVLGRKPFEFMSAKDAAQVEANFIQHLKDRRPFSLLENTCLHKNGHEVVLETSGTPIFDPAGHFVGYQGIDRDITKRKQVVAALRDSEVRYRTLTESSPLAIQVFAPDGRTLRVNAAWEKLWQTPFSALANYNVLRDGQLAELGILPWLQRAFAGEWVEIPITEYDKAKTLEVPNSGGTIWLHSFAYPVLGEDNQVLEVVVIHEDVTESKKAEQSLKQQKEYLRVIFETEPEGVQVVSLDGRFEDINPAGLKMLEVGSLQEAQQQNLLRFIAPGYRRALVGLLKRVRVGESATLEFMIRGKLGTERWLETHSTPLRDGNGNIVSLLGITRDITEHKQFQQKLEQQARTDFLTGINNRRYFMELAETELSRALRYNTPLSLLMMDIDFFKNVNDEYGHKAGDTALKKLGQVCRETLREVDIAGRMGGEEFAVLLPETASEKALEAAERLRDAIAKVDVPLEYGLPLRISVSIGVASLRSGSESLDALLNRADKGLYQAKSKGRNQVCVA